MDWSYKLCIAAFIIVSAAISGINGDVMVTGTVFCDQCKDGQISLFDYPLSGVKVTMSCLGGDGTTITLGEETTDWIGHYAMKFQGTPDLTSCSVQVSGGGGCGATAGPAKSLRLMFQMFGMEMYTVDPLISQPAQPIPMCPSSVKPPPVPTPVITGKAPPPPSSWSWPPLPRSPPSTPVPTPVITGKAPPPPSSWSWPPLPRSPPSTPVPFMEASACPHQKWTMPEYQCYWKVVTPDTKVALAFGLIAVRRYGTDLTLGKAMLGRGEAYRTLLREGTTALLNSYNSNQFPFNPLRVIEHMNWALMGSTDQALHTALQFMRANSGNSRVPCKFTPCK